MSKLVELEKKLHRKHRVRDTTDWIMLSLFIFAGLKNLFFSHPCLFSRLVLLEEVKSVRSLLGQLWIRSLL